LIFASFVEIPPIFLARWDEGIAESGQIFPVISGKMGSVAD